MNKRIKKKLAKSRSPVVLWAVAVYTAVDGEPEEAFCEPNKRQLFLDQLVCRTAAKKFAESMGFGFFDDTPTKRQLRATDNSSWVSVEPYYLNT